MMEQGRLFRILRFLNFCSNLSQPEKSDKNMVTFQKSLSLSDMLSDNCTKFYSLFEHLAVAEVIAL
jgi:hypothetical protein